MALALPIRVVVLLDQPLLVQTVALTLNHGAFVTKATRDRQDTLTTISQWQPQLAVVDMDLSGETLLREISARKDKNETPLPVLALTRRGDLQSKLAAFAQGVDDIMTIPFSPEELLARVLVIARRTYGEPVPFEPVLHIGELAIDILHQRVFAGTSEVHLTGLEQSLLYVLAANAGRVVSRDEIMDAVWGVDFVAESNVVDRHVRSLRVKLQNSWRRPRFIATVPREGYRFIPIFTNEALSGEAVGSSANPS